MSWVVVVIVVAVVVFFLFVLVALYNRLVRLRNRSENAWAQVDVQLRRRYDLVPNLVEAVKGYAAHERGVFENVTKARTAAQQAQGVEQCYGWFDRTPYAGAEDTIWVAHRADVG